VREASGAIGLRDRGTEGPMEWGRGSGRGAVQRTWAAHAPPCERECRDFVRVVYSHGSQLGLRAEKGVQIEEIAAQSVSVPSGRRALEPCLRQDNAQLLGSFLQEIIEIFLGFSVLRIQHRKIQGIHEDLQRSNAATCI
jgi:hypothetical protein